MFFKKNKRNNELPYGWSGDYVSWEEASSVTAGYDAASILEKVKQALLKVKNGEAVYERDSVLFDKKEYSWPLLAMLLKISMEHGNKLNVIDFGGSLGSSYFQNREFLSGLSEIQWNIVEQKNFVEEGKKYFESEELKFFEDIKDCTLKTHSKILLASSVIQYINTPYQVLETIKDLDFEYIIFDRTAFIEGDRDVLTIQRVPPQLYEASYPAWFFNHRKFVSFLQDKYIHLADFDNGFTAPVKLGKKNAFWRGLIFKRK